MRALFVLLAIASFSLAQAGDIVVRGAIVHTMDGAPIKDGVVVVRKGKITAVGPAGKVTIPRGLETLHARVVTPGLVDAHTVVGFSGHLNQRHDQEQLEHSAPVQPELRAIDAYNAREVLIEWVRSFGVTTLHTGHAPGEVISGQTMIAKTRTGTAEDAVVVPSAMLAVTLGEGARHSGEDRKTPGTRSKVAALLRQALVNAQDYRRKRANPDAEKHPDRDLGLEVLSRVLAGELPLLVTVHRQQDIATALRIREEFDVPMVLDGAAEVALVLDEVKAAGVPVIVHPTMARAYGETENLGTETAAKLADAGVAVAFQSGYESYVPKTRVVLFEAALAAARGLGFERALAATTIDAARILGIDDRVGSLEVGKDGDLALYDGDPFEYTSHCTGVVIEGDIVHDQPR